MSSGYIDSFKTDPTVRRFTGEDGTIRGIRVLSKGENLFFHEGDQVLLCEIDAVAAVIYEDSIIRWENGSRLKKEERARLAMIILDLYRRAYNADAQLSSR